MTSQSSTTNANKKSIGAAALFKFTLKQSWTLILLFSIILFFVLPVLALMITSSYELTYSRDIADLRNEIKASWLPVIRYPLVVLGCVFAVVVSCKQFAHTKSKVATDFYHSLPLKRGQLFINGLLVCICAVIIPFVINLLLTVIVFGVNNVLTSGIFMGMLRMMADVLVYSAFCLSLTTLVGMVCGLTPVTLTLTLLALFIVPATVSAVLGFYNIFCENMWLYFYLDYNMLESTSPALRFFLNGELLGGIEASLMLFFSALMLVGAYFIYKIRKSERSGTPVVFGVLGEVIKYILVFLATLLLGLIFYYIMSESFFWTIFGMTCGAVLTFMLTNTILNKTAKAMFKGVKGLAVYGGAVAVGMIFLMSNAFGINSAVPSVQLTDRVVLSLDNEVTELVLRDKKSIEAIRKIYTEGQWYYEPYDESVQNRWNDDIRIEVVFYPEIGIPVAKSVMVYNKSAFIEEFRTILNDESFASQYTGMVKQYLETDELMHIRLELPSYAVGRANDRVWNDYRYHYEIRNYSGRENNGYTNDDYAINELLEYAQTADFDYFQQRMYGTVSFDNASGDTLYVQLRSDAHAVRERLIQSGLMYNTDDEELDKLTQLIDEIRVYDFDLAHNIDDTTPCIKVTDKARIREILEASINIYGEDRGQAGLQFNDRQFFAIYALDTTDAYDLKDNINSTEAELTKAEEEFQEFDYKYDRFILNTNVFRLYFRYGTTPDFLTE